MEYVKRYRDIKFLTTERRRNYLVSEPNYYSTKVFTGNLLTIEIKKSHITMNKCVYLGLVILDVRKTKKHDFWYDHIKPKYGEKAKLYYMDTDSFIAHIKTGDIYKDIAEDVESRFDTSNDEADRLLPMGKN